MVTNDRLELLGFLLVITFFAIVWWPSALLVAGIGLVVLATVRDRQAPAADPDGEEPTP